MAVDAAACARAGRRLSFWRSSPEFILHWLFEGIARWRLGRKTPDRHWLRRGLDDEATCKAEASTH